VNPTIHFSTALLLALSATAATAQGVVGKYTVEGRDFDGKSYSGELTIQAAGPVYRLRYSDGRTMRGMGILRGQQLFTAWGPNDRCTVSALLVGADGNMEGPWGDLAHDALGSETLRRQSGGGERLDGSYVSAGRTPDGEKYDGLVTFQTQGQTYRVRYKDDSSDSSGVAIRQGAGVGVAYGGNRCGISIYQINADGTLSGPYAEPGVGKLGVETLRRAR
jgi:hypothetical protein